MNQLNIISVISKRVIEIVSTFRSNVTIAFNAIHKNEKPFLTVYTYVRDFVKKVIGFDEDETSVTLRPIGDTVFTDTTATYTINYPAEFISPTLDNEEVLLSYTISLSGESSFDRTIDTLNISQ